jgi:hypothetical protein
MSSWKQSRVAHRRDRWQRFGRAKDKAADRANNGGMPMSSVNLTVAADPRLLSPTMRVAVIEDLCWAIAQADWEARRPSWWRRSAWRAWQRERAALDDKRGRVVDLIESAK